MVSKLYGNVDLFRCQNEILLVSYIYLYIPKKKCVWILEFLFVLAPLHAHPATAVAVTFISSLFKCLFTIKDG